MPRWDKCGNKWDAELELRPETILGLQAASSHHRANGHGGPARPERGRHGGHGGTLGSLRLQGVAENRSRAPGRSGARRSQDLRGQEGVKVPLSRR